MNSQKIAQALEAEFVIQFRAGMNYATEEAVQDFLARHFPIAPTPPTSAEAREIAEELGTVLISGTRAEDDLKKQRRAITFLRALPSAPVSGDDTLRRLAREVTETSKNGRWDLHNPAMRKLHDYLLTLPETDRILTPQETEFVRNHLSRKAAHLDASPDAAAEGGTKE